MDAKKFINRLDQFKPAVKDDFQDFKKIIEEYPFFQPAMVYLLKSVNHHQPHLFEFLLQQTASMTFDRFLLYRWLKNPIQRKEVEDSEQHPLRKVVSEITKEESDDKTVTQKKSAPLKMSFLDWVRHVNKEKKTTKEITLSIDKKIELFDAFISKAPRVNSKPEAKKMVDLSSESWASSSELMTETLAKVFIKQKKYKKAIKAYEILCLKYPEKNGFFADQIKTIKKIQQQKE